jgi:geranylgeranyl pyrophosphate synthase
MPVNYLHGSDCLNTSISFFAPVTSDIDAVEALMRSQADGHNSNLRTAIDIILSSGGKRIRPSVSLLVGQMLGGPHDRLVTLSAAIELLHTATLVHDDLIDNSMLRRGVATLNAHWSPGATVLTGDYMFACAARLAAETENIEVIKRFSQVLTTIVNGEITQLFSSRCQIKRDEYYSRIYAKTASLFEIAAQSAALLSLAPPEIAEKVRCFGYNIGMAFQIVDDILDFTSQPSALGKPVGSDLRQGLVTLPTIYYAENHPLQPEVMSLLNGICLDENQVQNIVGAIRKSSAITLAHAEAISFVQKGIQSLDELSPSPERDSLIALAEYIVQRDL